MSTRQHSKSLNKIFGFRSKDLRRRRRPSSMPQFASSLPGEFAADAVHKRCETFKFLKKLKKLPRKRMTHGVLVSLGLETAIDRTVPIR